MLQRRFVAIVAFVVLVGGTSALGHGALHATGRSPWQKAEASTHVDWAASFDGGRHGTEMGHVVRTSPSGDRVYVSGADNSGSRTGQWRRPRSSCTRLTPSL